MVCGFKFGSILKHWIITWTSDTEIRNYKTNILLRSLQTKGNSTYHDYRITYSYEGWKER